MTLANEACIPCRKGEAALGTMETLTMLKQLPKWLLVADGAAIKRQYKFKDFAEALVFVNRIADLAEMENHHPDIAFGWGYTEVTFTTHAIGGLHRNDFIMAAKVDNLA